MLASKSSRFLSKIETSAVFQRLRTASLVICTIAATSFAAPQTSEASTLIFDAVLGNFENPPTGSTGTGFAEITFDTVTLLMRVQVTFSGLSTPNTASHIHCCVAAPGNAGVATTVPTFTGFPGGVTAGTYDHTFDMTLASSYNPAFVTANGGTALSAEAVLLAGMIAGNAYLNIHTTQFGGGEIRGFLAETPLPAALPLFATGLGVLGLLGWRRKRKAAAA
jgi:CHRD domain